MTVSAWRRFLPGCAPPSAAQICAALEPVETPGAAAFLPRLATVDLLWPSHRHMPTETAERAAGQVVSLLLAGTDGEHFTLALQIADD